MWKYRLEHVILFIGMKSAQRAQRRARIMKKRNVAVLAAAVGLMLTACGNPKGTADNRSDSAAVSTDTVETRRQRRKHKSRKSFQLHRTMSPQTALIK